MSRKISASSVHEIVTIINGKKHSRKVKITVNGKEGKRVIHEDGKLKEDAKMTPTEIAYFLNHDTLHGHGYQAVPFVLAEQGERRLRSRVVKF